jgi:hypothetical protein
MRIANSAAHPPVLKPPLFREQKKRTIHVL